MKTYSSFINYFSSTSFAEALKSNSIGRIRVFLLIESVQTSLCGSICLRKRGEFTIANFGVKIGPFLDSDHENRFSFCSRN